MADSGRDDDNIPLLKPVALRADQILDAAIAPTAQQLVERVAVQLHRGVGEADILMGIDVAGGHFQLLIQIDGVEFKTAQNILIFLLTVPGRGVGYLCCHLLQFV